MYFLLLDPIFWINKTLATFDRMIAKLQKYIDKCEQELESNRDAILMTRMKAEADIQKKMEKEKAKIEKLEAKYATKMNKISEKATTQVDSVSTRNAALLNAQKRARTTADNLRKLTGDE